MESVQSIKQRFGITGENIMLQRAIEKAIQIANTDISVMIVGESGVGKEVIPKIIHRLSHRKHYPYIAVNCGAIPEGTIDSELFGHEKGAFTGATGNRKGYFEVADKGTAFLDEVGELPLSTQVRLLRVLESGEFIKVGSSQVQKNNVRIVAATNVDMVQAVRKGEFREDLYYRLNTVQIDIPALRNRKGDIRLLFKKFSNDFAEKYSRPSIKLSEEALLQLENYPWPGNIRQLRNFVEELSVMETQRNISIEKVKEYLPEIYPSALSSIVKKTESHDFSSEREFLYKLIFDIKRDQNELKKLLLEIIKNQDNKADFIKNNHQLIESIFSENFSSHYTNTPSLDAVHRIEDKRTQKPDEGSIYHRGEIQKINPDLKSISLQAKEEEFIREALRRNSENRKLAAKELGISERTLYRKIKEYGF